jgi:hypothetical protein
MLGSGELPVLSLFFREASAVDLNSALRSIGIAAQSVVDELGSTLSLLAKETKARMGVESLSFLDIKLLSDDLNSECREEILERLAVGLASRWWMPLKQRRQFHRYVAEVQEGARGVEAPVPSKAEIKQRLVAIGLLLALLKDENLQLVRLGGAWARSLDGRRRQIRPRYDLNGFAYLRWLGAAALRNAGDILKSDELLPGGVDPWTLPSSETQDRDEERLVEMALDGCQEAFGELVQGLKEHHPDVAAVLARASAAERDILLAAMVEDGWSSVEKRLAISATARRVRLHRMTRRLM